MFILFFYIGTYWNVGDNTGFYLIQTMKLFIGKKDISCVLC